MKFPEEPPIKDAGYFIPDTENPLDDYRNEVIYLGFRFMSLGKTAFCFNYELIDKDLYLRFLERIKQLTSTTFEGLSKTSGFHFHLLAPDANNNIRTAYRKLKEMLGLALNTSSATLPRLYQVALFTSQELSPRIVGFIDYHGVFQIIWLDYNHKLYPMSAKQRGLGTKK